MMLSQELLGVEKRLARVHQGIERQPHTVLAETERQTVSTSPEVRKRGLTTVKHCSPVTALLLVVF